MKNSKLCIFDKNKICDDCDKCNICDLNPNKRCDNCGKCLELEGYDIRAIKIDEVFESTRDVSEYEELNKIHDEANKKLNEDDDLWDFIDDVADVQDLIEREDELRLHFEEEYPGLIRYKKVNDAK